MNRSFDRRRQVKAYAICTALAVAGLIPRVAAAQVTAAGAQEIFYEVTLERDADAGRRAMIMEGLSEPIAAAMAAYWCSPPEGAGCAGTDVLRAWEYFLQALAEGNNADAAFNDMVGKTDDYPLGDAIAAWWCSPEPGTGCENTYLLAYWDVYLGGLTGRDYETVAGYDSGFADAMLAMDLLWSEEECGNACDPSSYTQPTQQGQPSAPPVAARPAQGEPRLLKLGIPEGMTKKPCAPGRHPDYPNCN